MADFAILRVGHAGGLGNRLDEIATACLLLDGAAPADLQVLWPVNEHMPARFHELFAAPVRGTVLEDELPPDAAGAFDALRRTLPADFRDSAAYRAALGGILARARPEFHAAAAAVAGDCRLDDGVVGVHVRRAEPGTPICPFAQPLRFYEAVMRAFPRQTRFFVSTDSPHAFRWLSARFAGRVFQREKRHTRTEVEGVGEALVDLLLLARCSRVIGTFRSSFSHLAAIAGRRPLLMVKPQLEVPAGWPRPEAWRWAWARRHFVMESTFWIREIYYTVRPRVGPVIRRLAPRFANRPAPWSRR